MNSTAIVEQVVRKGWVGADGSALDELVSSGRVTEILRLFHEAFTDVELTEFGPIFSNADTVISAHTARQSPSPPTSGPPGRTPPGRYP
jgi:hypothetical protein